MTRPNLEERLDRVEVHVRNIDLRLERVEQILPTLATKEDLRGVPTADDPKGFLTKKDAEAFLTKEDAKVFLTKEDAKAFLTKEDAKVFLTKEDAKGFLTKEDAKGFLTKDDGKAFATKEDLKGMPTVDDPKGFVTTADLDAFGERESAAMRTFVLEVVQKSSADLRNEMRVLFEEQRTWFVAMTDKIDSVCEELRSVDARARERDAELDHRVTRLERG